MRCVALDLNLDLDLLGRRLRLRLRTPPSPPPAPLQQPRFPYFSPNTPPPPRNNVTLFVFRFPFPARAHTKHTKPTKPTNNTRTGPSAHKTTSRCGRTTSAGRTSLMGFGWMIRLVSCLALQVTSAKLQVASARFQVFPFAVRRSLVPRLCNELRVGLLFLLAI